MAFTGKNYFRILGLGLGLGLGLACLWPWPWLPWFGLGLGLDTSGLVNIPDCLFTCDLVIVWMENNVSFATISKMNEQTSLVLHIISHWHILRNP